MKRVIGIAAALVLLVGTFAPSDAATAKINSFVATTAGSIAFTVLGFTAQSPGTPATYGFSLNYRTSGTPGTIAITAPNIIGTAGNTIPQAAFSAKCAAVSNPSGAFASSGIVRLGSAAVTCGTISAGVTDTLTFNVTLYIDENAGVSSFTADTYTSAPLSITATLP